MFTRVLIPLESAVQTPRVVAVARLLVRQRSRHDPLRVTLMHVTRHKPWRLARHTSGRAVTEAINEDLDLLVTRLHGEGIDAHSLRTYGATERGILDAAQQTQADLLVLMPHGPRSLCALAHPSVTAKLLTSATAPLLIWPERLPETYAGDFLRPSDAVVIVPLDGGERAERVLPHAADLANTFERTLLLVRVIPDLTPPIPGLGRGVCVGPEVLQAEQEEALAYLAMIGARAAQEITAPMQSLALLGAAAPNLLDLTSAHPGSVIVMSAHGGGALARATLGSLTMETVRAVAAPVLVIPPHAPPPLISIAPMPRSAVTVVAPD